MPVRHEPVVPRSRVKHSTTEPLSSKIDKVKVDQTGGLIRRSFEFT